MWKNFVRTRDCGRTRSGLIWPFDVICFKNDEHLLTTKGHSLAAKVSCHGEPLRSGKPKLLEEVYDAKEFNMKSFPTHLNAVKRAN